MDAVQEAGLITFVFTVQDNTNHFTFRNIVLQVILKWKISRHLKYIPLEFVCISLTPKSPRLCISAGYSCLV